MTDDPTAAHRTTDYAAIRWFANTLENKAIETYSGNPEALDGIRAVLEKAVLGLEKVRLDLGNRDKICYRCPWFCCPDDACSPMCGPRNRAFGEGELRRLLEDRLGQGLEPWPK